MTISVILAAGKGSRYKNNTINKSVALLSGKPLISYATDLTAQTTDSTTIVIGHKLDTVISAMEKNRKINFAVQKKRLGTGHALKVALKEKSFSNLGDQDIVLVGYADHMFLYTPTLAKEMIKKHLDLTPAITLVTTQYPDPNLLSWGRIVRNTSGFIEKIVEQKDATENEKMITELNAGLYIFNFGFLKKNINKLKKSVNTGEYYLTDLIYLAVQENLKVLPFLVDFEQVGFGVNTPEQLAENERLLKKRGEKNG